MSDAMPVRPSRRVAAYAPIAVLMAVAAAVLLFLARSMTFWQDEWGSITFHGDWVDLIRPVNEHWSMFPLPVYRATFALVGLHSYLPYIAEVVTFHLVAVAAAFVLMRRRAGVPVATLVSIPLLFLGSGSENLFWAFQTGFVGSVAFGLWGLVLIERPGRPSAVGAAILLIASLTSSGMGLVFLVAALGRTLLDPALRSRAMAVGPPAIVYAVWYLTVGQAPVTQAGHMADLLTVKGFVGRGIGHAVGAVSGLGSLPRGGALSVVAFAAAIVATGWAVIRTRRPPALAAGTLLAIVAMYTLLGLVRADLHSDFATRSRYVYVAAFLLVLAVVDWLPLLREWAQARRRGRVVLPSALIVVLAGAIAANLAAFGPIRAAFQAHADLTRAYVELAHANRDSAWADPTSVLPGMPPLPVLLATIDRYGSPASDDLLPGVVRRPGPKAHEEALLQLVGSGFHVEPANGATRTVQVQVVAAHDITTAIVDGCLTLTNAGGDASINARVPTETRIRLVTSNPTQIRALLGLTQAPSRAIDLEIGSGSPTDIVFPDIGANAIWSLRLDLPNARGPVQVCGVAPS